MGINDFLNSLWKLEHDQIQQTPLPTSSAGTAPAPPAPRPHAVLLWANAFRKIVQMLLSVVLLCIIVRAFYHYLCSGTDAQKEVVSPVLSEVGKVLAFAAAVDLAYMLITPGPDEAAGPVIIGIAAGMLILVSSIQFESPYHNLLLPSISVLLLALAIAVLFHIRKQV